MLITNENSVHKRLAYRAGFNAAIQKASERILADMIENPANAYQLLYNATLQATADEILKLKEPTND